MVLGAKFGVSSAFNCVFLANELFPSTYASTTMGVCNFFARLAAIVAPMAAEVAAPFPMSAFCVMAGGAMVASFFLRNKD